MNSRLDSPDFHSLLANPAHFIAWGFGAGLTPVLPGTAGSVLALVLYVLLLSSLSLPIYLGIIAVTTLIGIWASHQSERLLGEKDAAVIVIDEIVGMWIALILVPQGWIWLVTAFVLFRIFDIVKPWPIRLVDRQLGGGFGIMLDDIIAGILTLVSMMLLQILWGEIL